MKLHLLTLAQVLALIGPWPIPPPDWHRYRFGAANETTDSTTFRLAGFRRGFYYDLLDDRNDR